jgi:hypothetical protein
MKPSEQFLPNDILDRSTLIGNEYSWTVGDVPRVIEAARLANLVSIGGQLQFRFPDGEVCECYWVQVDTFQSVPAELPWSERVSRTAEAAASQFQFLLEKYDFISEGRSGFARYLDAFEMQGGDLNEIMRFVWYVESEDEAEQHRLFGS